MAAFTNTAFEFGGINHLALTCSDMQRTVDFYTNILGMKLVKTLEFTHESGSGQHFFFDVGNGRDAIAFFWFEDAPPPAPGIAQSGRWLPGAPRRSAIGAMDHVALDVPRDKIAAYRDKLRAKGIAVTEVVNHADRPGIAQYLPAEPNEDTFIRSIYFQDPDGITLEFACWGRPLTEADVVHEPKTAADLNYEKLVNALDHPASRLVPWREMSPAATMRLPALPAGCKVQVTDQGSCANILAPTVSKAQALQFVLAQRGLNFGQVMAFGDDISYMEMLVQSAIGVAMANALAEVLAIADRVTASNDEDGVALVLEELVGRT